MFLHLIRNAILGFGYRRIFKPWIFRYDAEVIHDSHVNLGKKLQKTRLGRAFTHAAFHYGHPLLEQTVYGLHFKSPIGLAAGFDKNAELIELMPHLGFGFEEVGSITAEPCEGNPKPRLWRHCAEQSIQVYYGFRNEGIAKIAPRLHKTPNFMLGASLKDDCLQTLPELTEKVDYVTLNFTHPQTYELGLLLEPEKLEILISKIDVPQPVFIKLSPDLTTPQVDTILDIATRHKITGFVVGNLTKNHSFGLGAISGKPIQEESDALLSYIYQKTQGRFILIGCGGVFSAEDAYRKIRLGASLVQVITGMIYRGPTLISDINMGLVRLLKRDGFKNISEAVGIDKK